MERSLLRYFPWRWTLYWLVAPNLALVLMWPFGGPPMGKPPMGKPLLIAGCLGLVCSQAPWLWFRRLSAVVLTLGMVAFYLARNFNIDPSQIAFAPTYLIEGAPLRSLGNVAAASAVLLSVAIVYLHVPQVPRFAIPMNWLMGFLAVIGVINFDNFATAATRGSYDAQVAPVALDSAVNTSGHAQPRADRRNLVVVLVEALGMPMSPVTHRLFEEDWNRPEWRARYDVSAGSVPYFGSTTNAEMRELCGVWSLNR